MRDGTRLAAWNPATPETLDLAECGPAFLPTDRRAALAVECSGGPAVPAKRQKASAKLEVGPPLRKAAAAWKLHDGDKLVVRKLAPAEFLVSPAWRPFKFIDLFAGIGGLRLGFQHTGGQCVFSSEIDPRAVAAYHAAFGEAPHGDLAKIAAKDVPDHDILLGGFPCQPFSIIGKREGFADTRGTLFFEIERLLEAKRPAAAVLENVKQFRTHDGGRTQATALAALHRLGYATHVGTLNARNFGVPQQRERVFIVALRGDLDFRWPVPARWREPLEQLLERDEDVDPALFASPRIQERRLERLREQGVEPKFPSIWHENKGGHLGVHPYSCALRSNASYSYLLVNGRRRPTARELFRLQGFPESYPLPPTVAAARFLTGNAVAVPVADALAGAVQEALRLQTRKTTKTPTGLFSEAP